MSQKETVFKQKLKHKGFFSYKDFYDFCFSFLKDNNFSLKEKEYEEKASGDSRDIGFKWEASREVTDYFKYVLDIKCSIRGLREAEVEREGKKVKMNSGEVGVEIEGLIEKDYEQNWEKKPFLKMMRGVYDKYIIRTTADEYSGRLGAFAAEFVSQIKSFLQLGR